MSERSPALPPGEPRRTIFLVATEESGDRLGAQLMRALTSQTRGAVRFVGLGGRGMAAEGLVTAVSTKEFANIGIGVAIRRLPSLLRYIRETATAALAARPDVLVIIDSPDFTHRVARIVRARAPAIRIVNYVSPSVWAWRPWRARAMRRYVDHVLALLPFEPAVHVRLGGPPCSYVGHPLITQIGQLRPNADEERRRLADPPVLLVLPGSRSGEIRRLAPIFGEALALLRDRSGPFELVLPTVTPLAEQVRQATARWPVQPRILVDADEKHAAFRSARAALAKSGTVTLELALAEVPMVTAYRLPFVESLIMRLMASIDTVILPNLVVGHKFVPEFLQGDCTPQNLADALLPLLRDSPERRRQLEGFKRLDGIMQIGGVSPSERAAEIVLRLANPTAGGLAYAGSDSAPEVPP